MNALMRIAEPAAPVTTEVKRVTVTHRFAGRWTAGAVAFGVAAALWVQANGKEPNASASTKTTATTALAASTAPVTAAPAPAEEPPKK